MDRRKFLIGVGGASIGGSALLGSGAFSRVESQRDVTIQVAEDPDAYLGLDQVEGSANSDNYVGLDENGHLEIDIGDQGGYGEGVNSDSFTWFDSMVQVCNQGKEDVGFYIQEPTDDDFPGDIDATGPDGTPYEDEPRLQFYTGEAAGVGDDGTSSVMGEDNAVVIPLGECIELGVRTMTKGVDATEEDELFGDEVVLIADASVSGVPAEEAPEFVSAARIRDGGPGGWSLAIGEPVPGGNEAEDFGVDWDTDETYSFEFSYDGDEYELRVEDGDGDEVDTISTADVSAPMEGSQLRLSIRASDSEASISNAEVNGTALDDISAEDDAATTAPVVTFDTNDFTLSGDFQFAQLDGGERPAIDIQIEGFDD